MLSSQNFFLKTFLPRGPFLFAGCELSKERPTRPDSFYELQFSPLALRRVKPRLFAQSRLPVLKAISFNTGPRTPAVDLEKLPEDDVPVELVERFFVFVANLVAVPLFLEWDLAL